ncbi:hypothetical protein TD95_002174 [Thielaviopsis punctulata]|uniref:Splicing factor Cactin n=1 Tax=Thielaviopsis punctulata TaxID=72032 RepID=A0A0F4ZGL6_9PEZI|nr:hypothetical protein TD95_002174 [Thielaviopsis punctulata]
MNPDRQAMIEGRRGRPSDLDRSRPVDSDRSRPSDSNRSRSDRDRDDRRDRPRDRDYSSRDHRRDITAPRRDRHARVSKPSSRTPTSSSSSARFLTQDQQSEQFVADEDKFVLQQAKKKADIRVREARATPIDNLVFPLRYIEERRADWDEEEDVVDIDVPEPAAVLQSATPAQLAELKAEIASYRTLETNPASREYWDVVHTLATEALAASNTRVAAGVKQDIDKILAPKSLDQLAVLERQIRQKLAADDPDIDVDYWEQLLHSLLVWSARARLAAISESMRRARAALLRPRNPQKADALEAGALPVVPVATQQQQQQQQQQHKQQQHKQPAPMEKAAVSLKAAASASAGAPPPGTARFAQTGPEDFSAATKALYEREVARGIREDEEVFAAEEAVPTSSAAAAAAASGKYRPRKPRYFNRVQMGYDWNKYNQTHYDHDNPPPKVVQGYKFNIFYPELLDKTKAPTFKIIRDNGRRQGESAGGAAGEEDTCLIRFIAGAPYEDVAFRIVDREWDYSSKKERGFKSSFDNHDV